MHQKVIGVRVASIGSFSAFVLLVTGVTIFLLFSLAIIEDDHLIHAEHCEGTRYLTSQTCLEFMRLCAASLSEMTCIKADSYYLAMMLPGNATVRVYARTCSGWKTAVGFEVSSPLVVRWPGSRFRLISSQY